MPSSHKLRLNTDWLHDWPRRELRVAQHVSHGREREPAVAFPHDWSQIVLESWVVARTSPTNRRRW